MELYGYVRTVEQRRKIYLLLSFICYIAGCACWYFLWYKNGQFLHIAIIFLFVAGLCGSIELVKRYYFSRKSKSVQIFFIIMLIILLVGFAAFVSSKGTKRVESILNNEPTKQTIATVVSIDFRSTRSGKQPWSVINYKVNNEIIEQSFAEIGRNLRTGRKYLVQYSLEYPDMFRILREIN
jgi:predicted PurR-regulated permease PerM